MFGLSFRRDDWKSQFNSIYLEHIDSPPPAVGELIHKNPSELGPEVLEIRTGDDALHFQFGPSGAYFADDELQVWGPQNQYLLERVIAPVLAWSGLETGLIVHGSMVVDSDKTVLLCGASGVGKSSTAYALTNFGWKVGTDDIAVVDVDASLAYGAGTGALLRTPIAPGQVLEGTPTREGKVRVAEQHNVEQAELAACVFLERGESFSHRRMPEPESYVAVLRASFRFYPGTSEFSAERSKAARELISNVPCLSLTVPGNPEGPFPMEVEKIDHFLRSLLEGEQ